MRGSMTNLKERTVRGATFRSPQPKANGDFSSMSYELAKYMFEMQKANNYK